MEFSCFDLKRIQDTLWHIIQTEEDNSLFNKKVLQDTVRAIAYILTKYPDTTVFVVQPDELEEQRTPKYNLPKDAPLILNILFNQAKLRAEQVMAELTRISYEREHKYRKKER